MPDTAWGLITPIDGSTATSSQKAIDILDSRIAEANNALTWLKQQVDSTNNKSAVIRHNVPIDSTVYTGCLVYFDATKSKFCPAQALLLPESTAGGNTIEAPEARVEGLIIDRYTGSSGILGTLLVGGYWNDDTVMTNCLTGTDTTAGVYYLSPSVAGKATKETYGHLRQPVLSYYGTGAGFSLSLFYMAHDNHFHASQVLESNWAPVTGSTTAPSGANFVYTGTYDLGLGTLGDTTAVFYNGLLEVPGSAQNANFIVQDEKLYCALATPPAANSVTIFNHYPFAYENAIIRSVYSDSDSLTVENTNGIIKLTANDFVAGEIAPSAYAVSGIQGKTMTFTPIVANVYAGPGIAVSRSVDGGAYVSTASLIGGLMDAYSINHNGTTLVSAGALEYITFQTSRNSNFVMTVPVKGISTPCSVSVWAMKRGTTAVSPGLGVEVMWIPNPTTDAAGTVDVTGQTAALSFPAGTDADTLTYNEVSISGITVSTDGMLVAKVSASNPTNQIQLLRAGFKLDVIGVSGSAYTVDTSMAIRQTMTAGTALNAGDCVYVNNNQLFKCRNSITESGTDTTNRCVGIVEVGGSQGDQVTYVMAGPMVLSNAPGSSGDALYIGKDGHVRILDDEDILTFLSTTAPSGATEEELKNYQARYLQKVGTVLATGVIQVSVESAVKGTAS